jgi:hypothetical protein
MSLITSLKYNINIYLIHSLLLSFDLQLDKEFTLSKLYLAITMLYTRGGQLFWLGGHFVEAEVGGWPHLLK